MVCFHSVLSETVHCSVAMHWFQGERRLILQYDAAFDARCYIGANLCNLLIGKVSTVQKTEEQPRLILKASIFR